MNFKEFYFSHYVDMMHFVDQYWDRVISVKHYKATSNLELPWIVTINESVKCVKPMQDATPKPVYYPYDSEPGPNAIRKSDVRHATGSYEIGSGRD